MNLNLDEVHHRIRTDQRFKKRMKRVVVFGCLGILLIVILIIAAIIMFSSAIISFVFANAPAAFEFVFNNAREFAGTFMLNDINSLLQPIAGSANATEFKTLVTQYFEQLPTNPAIDFQNFQSFVSTVRSSIADSQITPSELDSVRNFLIK